VGNNLINLVQKLKLKVFNIDAHLLRGNNFFGSILEYREKIFPLHKNRIQDDEKFQCILCKNNHGKEFLAWEKTYKLFKCSSCGAVSPNIRLFDEGEYIKSIYDTNDYKDKLIRETHKQYEYRKKTFGTERFQYTVERLGLGQKSKVLDIGCGAGYYLSVLADNKIHYKGLEVARHFVDYCKSHHNLNVANTPIEKEEDNYYDLITMFDVLEHLANPISTLNIISNKLKIGGYCVAYTPNIHSIGYELMGAKQNTLLPFEHLCFFNKESLYHLADKAGMEITKIEVFGLDIMDYLLMKEHEDNVNYIDNIKDMMNLVQSVLDKHEIGNHFRITFLKKK